MKSILSILTMSASLAISACSASLTDPHPDSRLIERGAPLDAHIEALMEREQVVGLAVAVIEGDEITHLNAYGYRNLEQGLRLQTDTVMYGASLTKAAFAYMVLQLVDEGQIDPDQPIAELLERPLPDYPRWTVLEGDEDWRALTPRHLLSHTTGLANLRFLEPNRDLRFHFEPGTSYAYSGEGFWLMQFVLEEALGLDVKAEMQARIFDRFEMTRTDMQWREAWRDNLADGYAMDGSFEPHDERSNVSASGSMDTTIADQAHMWRGMLAGEGLSEAMRAEWVSGQFPIQTAQKFPTIQVHQTRDPRGPAIDLSAGLGVEVWQGQAGPAFAKGGHNDWTGNIVICHELQDRCLVMLGNSVRAEIIFPEIAEAVLGETGYPWWWTYPRQHGEPIDLEAPSQD